MKKFDITKTLIYKLDSAARMARAAGARFFENCKELDITFNEFYIINTLHHNPNMHQRNLAKLLQKSPANLSRDLNKLEQKGLVKRSIETRGKWVVKSLLLTDKGEEILQKALTLAEQNINKIYKIYTPKEYEQFKEFLNRFVAEIANN